jgi:hypothetical protein
MANKRLYQPSILIDSVEYRAKAGSVKLEPGDYHNFSEEEFTFEADIQLDYAVAGSWNLLYALAGTLVDVVLKPDSASVAVTNPTATFQIRMPSPTFMDGARGDRQSFALSAMTEEVPVFATS